MGKAEYPKDHKPGMKVPKGGSSCANCRFLRPGLKCSNEYFQRWNGSDKIPAASADAYCSDFYEPGDRARVTLGEQVREQRAVK